MFFLLVNAACSAQNSLVVDSLIHQLRLYEDSKQKSGAASPAIADSVKADILYQLSREYWSGNLDTAALYADRVLSLSEKINYKEGIGNAYASRGVIYWFQGDYINALLYNEKSLKEREQVGDKAAIAKSYHNIGLVYDDQGNFTEALKNYLHALKLNEEIDDKSGIATEYNVIGVIHYNQKNYPEALESYIHSLNIRKQLGDKYDLTESYSNLGLLYFDMGDIAKCMQNYNEALKLRKEIEDRQGIAISYNNFGDVYLHEKKYSEAVKSYQKAQEINVQLGYRKSESSVLLSMGKAYFLKGNLSDALKHTNASISIAKELGALDYLANGYKNLAEYYSQSGDFKKAFEFERLYKQTDDSLFNSGKVKELTRLQMQYEFSKKETAAKAEQDKKDAVAAEELKRQRNIRNSIIAGLAGLLLFTIVVVRQRNKVKKEKKRSDELLLNILPAETAEELKNTGSAKAKDFEEVTVMFTDFKNFTKMSEQLSAQELVNEINYCYSAFDNIIGKHGIEKIKTIGDAYMCAGGLPVPNKTNAQDVVNAAIEIRDFMMIEMHKRQAGNRPFFEIRVGCHTGPVVAGIVGVKKFAYDIWGDTVNIAARMESSGEPGKVNISGSTYHLVKEKFMCTHRGKIEAKNKGMIDMYFVEKSNNVISNLYL